MINSKDRQKETILINKFLALNQNKNDIFSRVKN